MDLKNAVLGIMFLGLFAGTLMAISGTSSITVSQSRWNGAVTAQSALTQGGNISSANIGTTQLTSKWAAYYGNLTGTIRLSGTETGAAVYVWTYAASNGGEVCVSTGSAQSFSAPLTAVTGTIDTAFVTTGAPDNAAGTFNTTCPTLTLNTGAMTGFIAAATQGSSTFTTCAGTFGGATAIGDHGFCTNINSAGKNYLNSTNNYEMIVPTGTSNRTYYFYAELN